METDLCAKWLYAGICIEDLAAARVQGLAQLVLCLLHLRSLLPHLEHGEWLGVAAVVADGCGRPGSEENGGYHGVTITPPWLLLGTA